MSNIRSVEFRPEVNAELVKKLEEILSMAKSGELTGGAFAAPCRDGSAISAYVPTENRLLEIAALSRLLHRLHLAMDGGTTEGLK